MNDHMDAMLAFAARNADFAEEDNDGDGVSGCWYALGEKNNAEYALEPAAPKHSGHSQVITVSGQASGNSGIGQKIAIRGNVRYSVKLFARIAGTADQVRIEVVDIHSGECIGSVAIELSGHRWTEYTAELFVEKDCPEAELRLLLHSRISVNSKSKGTIWIDHLSLLSGDSVGFVKREVYELAKQLNSGIMRFGGNEISGYHWEEVIGPVYERADRKSEAWGHWTNKYMGTDECLSLCRDLDVEPLICVNAGSGTAEEAARWVEYCKGKVRYWEIGNEMYGDWQIGHCTAEEYGNKFMEFVQAMKAVDPDIVVIGCGSVNQEWNEQVLGIAGAHMDYLALHYYHRYKAIGIPEDASAEEKFMAMACASEIFREIIHSTASMIKRSDSYHHVKIAVTEYNVFYSNSKNGKPGNHTLEAAIANALILQEIIRNSDMIQIANYSDLVNGWEGGCIRVADEYYHSLYGKTAGWTGGNSAVYGTPGYHVLTMYANKEIGYVVESDVQCDAFGVTLGAMYEEFNHHPVVRPMYQFAKKANLQKLPVIDMVACMNEQMNKLTLFIVNRSFAPICFTVNLQNFNLDFTRRSVKLISSPSIEDMNTAADPVLVSEKPDLQESESINVLNLVAHSIYCVEFFP